MALPNIFSRRKRIASGMVTDVYTYDAVPSKVRVQIVQLIVEGLGAYGRYQEGRVWWDHIAEQMRKETGVFHLTNGRDDPATEFANWLLGEQDIDTFLDGLEMAFLAISLFKGARNSTEFHRLRDELNSRLQEAGVGFEFQSDSIIQINQQVIHKEVVLPALQLLHDKRFAGANDEYLDAHRFFRGGDYESCLIECGKAFESVLKVIAMKRNWPVTPNDTASKLIAAAFQTDFIPQYMQAQFTALRAVLVSGVPTVRNRMSGHGSGGQIRQVDKHLAAYQLHQTAAAIVFLVEHDNAMR